MVILGGTGRNFAAGMSGGIAWIFDPSQTFSGLCNREMVDLDPVTDIAHESELRSLIEKHFKFTGSTVAETILADWKNQLRKFVMVMPTDYKRVLAAKKHAVSAG